MRQIITKPDKFAAIFNGAVPNAFKAINPEEICMLAEFKPSGITVTLVGKIF